MDGPSTPTDQVRRSELGRFLRAHRAAVRPADRGLNIGPRRRSAGLLREEVAQLAGLSTTWYTYLEQGRAIHPSAETLHEVGAVLGLSDDEQRYMLHLAFGPPAPPESMSAEQLALVPAVVAMFADSPHPMYVGTDYGEVVGWNPAAVRWYTDFAALPGRRSMMRWLLVDPKARDRLVDWADDTRNMVARLRAVFANRPDDRRMHAVVSELVQISPEFRTWWGEHRVLGNQTRTRRLRHPILGERTYTITTLRAADDSFVSYMVHVPKSSGGADQGRTRTGGLAGLGAA